jgi:hypothetical protein
MLTVKGALSVAPEFELTVESVVESSSELHASNRGMPKVASTTGLQAVFKKSLLFFIAIFV